MTNDAGNVLLVLTNLPDRESALRLATALVEKRLAACVNVLDGCTSVYRWQDAVQTEREIPLLIKTRTERFDALRDAIIAAHPYDLPEVIALRLDDGLDAYLQWVGVEVDFSA